MNEKTQEIKEEKLSVEDRINELTPEQVQKLRSMFNTLSNKFRCNEKRLAKRRAKNKVAKKSRRKNRRK